MIVCHGEDFDIDSMHLAKCFRPFSCKTSAIELTKGYSMNKLFTITHPEKKKLSVCVDPLDLR